MISLATAAFEEGAGNYGNAQGSPFGSGFGGAQGNPFGGGFHGSYSDGNGYHEYHFENGEDMDDILKNIFGGGFKKSKSSGGFGSGRLRWQWISRKWFWRIRKQWNWRLRQWLWYRWK
ncbi:hypothetical protein M5E86_04605 [Blautia wexlerae]|nr:hypothetical protein M5E86_04605 [Blautia wexlerae]